MQCIAACQEQGYKTLLLDVHKMTGHLSIPEVYDFARTDLPALYQGLGLKVAIPDAQEYSDRFQFLENVAVNTGINLRTFSDPRKAQKWLRAA